MDWLVLWPDTLLPHTANVTGVGALALGQRVPLPAAMRCSVWQLHSATCAHWPCRHVRTLDCAEARGASKPLMRSHLFIHALPRCSGAGYGCGRYPAQHGAAAAARPGHALCLLGWYPCDGTMMTVPGSRLVQSTAQSAQKDCSASKPKLAALHRMPKQSMTHMALVPKTPHTQRYT